MYFIIRLPLTFQDRLGMSVDLAVTGTAIFELVGAIIMLASFIREKHKSDGRKEQEKKDQDKLEAFLDKHGASISDDVKKKLIREFKLEM